MTNLIRLMLLMLAYLPRPVLQAIGRLVGLVNFYLGSRAARVTEANLRLCYSKSLETEAGRHELKRQVRSSLLATGQTMLETPAVWLGSLSRMDGWIDQVFGEDKLRQALSSERGLLVLLPHTGNWELFNVFFRRYGVMTALYHPPRQPVMQDLMADVRGRYGNEMVPTTRQGLTRLYRALGSGGTVVVLPDQVPASGRFVPFFNQQALTDELAVRLLHKTGAIALGICIIRNKNRRFDIHIIEPGEEIYAQDLDTSTDAVNRLIEECVELDPAQYQWEYKRFRERPAGEAKIYRFGKPPGVHS